MPPIDEEVERDPNVVIVEGPLPTRQLEELAFLEEPVKILIHKGGDKLSQRYTDYVAINGTPCEMLFKNGWVPMGYFPRGISFYTKRKYVGVLARAKRDAITSDYVMPSNLNEDPINSIETSTQSVLSFSVLEDKNPRGAEWLELLVRANN